MQGFLPRFSGEPGGATRQRIFVCGAEVTSYVTSTAASNDDGPSPSTFSIDLVNAANMFTLTVEDVRTIFSPVGDFDEGEDENAVDRRNAVLYQVLQRIGDAAMPPLKKRVLLAKLAAPALRLDSIADLEANIGIKNFRQFLQQQVARDRTIGNSITYAGVDLGDPTGRNDVLLRYDFRVNTPIFHASDAVTIFELCPTTNEWHWVACGNPIGFTRTETDRGRSTLRLSCEDTLRSLRDAQVSFNPALTDYRWIATNQEQVTQTFFTDGLHDVPFYAVPYVMIFGSRQVQLNSTFTGLNAAGSTAAQGVTGSAGRPEQLLLGVNGYALRTLRENEEYAAGFYDLENSRLFFYGPDVDPKATVPIKTLQRNARYVNSLGDYQLLTDTRVDLADITRKAFFGARLPFAGVSAANAEVVFASEGGQNNAENADRFGSGLSAIDAQYSGSNRTLDLDYFRARAQKCIRLQQTTQGGARGGVTGNPISFEIRVDYDALVTELGTNPHIYPPHQARVYGLFPAAFATESDVTNFSLHSGPEMRTEFKSRLAVISSLAARVEHSIYATPKGDIAIEFPLYDFRPEDYRIDPTGSAAREWREAQTQLIDRKALRERLDQFAAGLINSELNILLPPLDPNLFVSRYTLRPGSYVGSSLTLNSAQIISQVETSYYITADTADGKAADFGEEQQVVSSPTLIAQYGLHAAREDPLGSFVDSPQAAEAFAGIAFNRLNAEVETGSLPAVFPRLGLQPNRVVSFSEGYACARLKSVTLTRAVGASYNLALGFNQYRAWNGLMTESRITGKSLPWLTAIGSDLGRPINWRDFMAGLRDRPAAYAPVDWKKYERKKGAGRRLPVFRQDEELIQKKARALEMWFRTIFAPQAALRSGQAIQSGAGGLAPRLIGTYRSPESDRAAGRQPGLHNIGEAIDFNPSDLLVPRGPGGVALANANAPAMLDLFEAASATVGQTYNVTLVDSGVGQSLANPEVYSVTPSFALLHTGDKTGLSGWHIHLEAHIARVGRGVSAGQ